METCNFRAIVTLCLSNRYRGSDVNRSQQRSRTNTAHAYSDRYNAMEEEAPPPQPERPSIRSNRAVSNIVPPSPIKERGAFDLPPSRPIISRSTTLGPGRVTRDLSPMGAAPHMARVPSDSLSIRAQKAQLRSVSASPGDNDGLDEISDASTYYTNDTERSDRQYESGSSPATSSGNLMPGRMFSGGAPGIAGSVKKAPPPPPPLRSKKPPPPPPVRRGTSGQQDANYA